MRLHRRAILQMIIVALLGIAVTIFIYLSAIWQDDQRIRSLIEFRADWRATDLSWKLEGTGQSVQSIASVIAADPWLTVAEMRRINVRPLVRGDSISALAWAPRVISDRRESFESEARASGVDGFRILERTQAGIAPVAGSRAEYFPILHTWALDSQPMTLGVDIFGDPNVATAALAARDRGAIVATTTIRSVITGQLSVIPVAPVYAAESVPTTVEERRRLLRGFVIGRVQISEALRQAIAGTPDIVEDIYFFPETPGSAPLAAFTAESNGLTTDVAPVDLTKLKGEIVYKRIPILDSSWTAAFHFAPNYLARERAHGIWGILIAGALGTIGILSFLGYQLVQVQRSSTLAAQRGTALEHESAERIRAETTSSAIIEQSPFAIIGLTPTRSVMLWNKAAERIFGYTAEEVIGRPYPLVPEGGLPEFDRIISRVSAGERLADVEVRRQRKDGVLIDVIFSGAPLYEQGRKLGGLVFVLQDVTERKTIEAQLRQSQKMEAVGQLSGGIAHDFNNMLGAIIGNLDIALEEKKDIPAIHKTVETTIDIAVRGGELVQRLLAFARRQMLIPKRIAVATIIDNLVPVLRRTLGETVNIRSDHGAAIWPVVADAAQLESAILNLSINARDAMPKGGTLTISASNSPIDEDMSPIYPDLKPGDYVMIEVADTGTGMTADVLSRAFEPFFTTKEMGKGTGLGLSMVYGFLRQTGGTVKIYSEVGHGTSVHLYLPRAEPEAEEVKPVQPAVGVPRGTERVLVVEDNPQVREVACTMLAGLGYRVESVVDAIQALRVLETDTDFGLIFSDVVMPGMSGIELAEEVRRKYPQMKILLTSGFASPVAVREQAREIGVDLLPKPYRRVTLANRLRQAIDGAAPEPTNGGAGI